LCETVVVHVGSTSRLFAPSFLIASCFFTFYSLYLTPCTTWLYGRFYCLMLGEVANVPNRI